LYTSLIEHTRTGKKCTALLDMNVVMPTAQVKTTCSDCVNLAFLDVINVRPNKEFEMGGYLAIYVKTAKYEKVKT